MRIDGVCLLLLTPDGLDGDLASHLGNAGAAIVVARVAETALELCDTKQHLLDAVVIDLRPDGRDEGLKALMAPASADKPGAPMPVVIVSDRIGEPMIHPSQVAAWIMSPIDVEALLHGVEHATIVSRRARARRG